MDTNTQLANDICFLVAPLRFLWHALLWFLFLLLAPVVFAVVPILSVRYASPDEIWLLKWAFGVLAPFVAAFWYVIIAMIPKLNRGEHGLAFQFKAFGSMAFGFVVSAGSMFLFAANYDVQYNWDDRGWFTGAWLALLSPFALLYVWRLVKRVRRGGE